MKAILCIVVAVACFLGAVALPEEAPVWATYGLMFWGAVLSIMATKME